MYANAKGIKIIGDMPIYVGGQSADVWANRHLFELNEESCAPDNVSGVPPDAFSATGQLWGSPLYRWGGGGACAGFGGPSLCNEIEHSRSFPVHGHVCSSAYDCLKPGGLIGTCMLCSASGHGSSRPQRNTVATLVKRCRS